VKATTYRALYELAAVLALLAIVFAGGFTAGVLCATR